MKRQLRRAFTGLFPGILAGLSFFPSLAMGETCKLTYPNGPTAVEIAVSWESAPVREAFPMRPDIAARLESAGLNQALDEAICFSNKNHMASYRRVRDAFVARMGFPFTAQDFFTIASGRQALEKAIGHRILRPVHVTIQRNVHEVWRRIRENRDLFGIMYGYDYPQTPGGLGLLGTFGLGIAESIGIRELVVLHKKNPALALLPAATAADLETLKWGADGKPALSARRVTLEQLHTVLNRLRCGTFSIGSFQKPYHFRWLKDVLAGIGGVKQAVDILNGGQMTFIKFFGGIQIVPTSEESVDDVVDSIFVDATREAALTIASQTVLNAYQGRKPGRARELTALLLHNPLNPHTRYIRPLGLYYDITRSSPEFDAWMAEIKARLAVPVNRATLGGKYSGLTAPTFGVYEFYPFDPATYPTNSGMNDPVPPSQLTPAGDCGL